MKHNHVEKKKFKQLNGRLDIADGKGASSNEINKLL